MAKLKDRVSFALDEARMLILGAQLLVGFQYRAAFEPGFESLPFLSRLLVAAGLGLMLVAVALLIAPTAYHRIVERGEDSEEFHRYTTRLMNMALLPFALGLALDFYIVAQKIIGGRWGILAGVLAFAVAVFFWYVLELIRRRERAPEIKERREMEKQENDEQDEASKLKDKIKHALTEARVVLPGAQALLGFQFVATLMESFDKLPDASKYVHLMSLAMTAVTIVFLMTPAAYHRIVEQGEETEHFHRFASRMIIAALVPLALGVCGEIYVVVLKVLDSQLVAVVSALVILALFWELWFGITLYRRTQRDHAAP
jgi:DMSO reductase anchor subunit